MENSRKLCTSCKVGYIYDGDNYCANCGCKAIQRFTTKIKFCRVDQEYRVLLLDNEKALKNATYYTDDREDAEETSRAMLRGKNDL